MYLRNNMPVGDDSNPMTGIASGVVTGVASGAANQPSKSWWDSITDALSAATTQTPATASPPFVPVAPAPGMSTTTKIAIAGGAVLLAVLIAKR